MIRTGLASFRRRQVVALSQQNGIQRSLSTNAPKNELDNHGNDDETTQFTMGLKGLPERFLREMDDSNFDPSTHQRNDLRFDAQTGKPIPPASSSSSRNVQPGNDDVDLKYTVKSRMWEANAQVIEWGDGVVSRYPRDWMDHILSTLDARTNAQPTLWTNLDEETVRHSSKLSRSFQDVLDKSGSVLQSLFQYGIVLVTNTPTDDGGAGLAAMASALSGGCKKTQNHSLLSTYKQGREEIVLPVGTDGPMRTLYGTIWSTTSSSDNDAAVTHGSDSVPLHTDMAYYRDPPGLQFFTMKQPSVRGGESVFCDGFAAAMILQQEHPETFETLATVDRTYRRVDKETGWHLEARGPIIETNGCSGQIVGIRHNDLDRMPDLPPPGVEQIHEYYQKLAQAHRVWNDTLARDDIRLVMKLQEGDTVILANQVSGNLCFFLPRGLVIEIFLTQPLCSFFFFFFFFFLLLL